MVEPPLFFISLPICKPRGLYESGAACACALPWGGPRRINRNTSRKQCFSFEYNESPTAELIEGLMPCKKDVA